MSHEVTKEQREFYSFFRDKTHCKMENLVVAANQLGFDAKLESEEYDDGSGMNYWIEWEDRIYEKNLYSKRTGIDFAQDLWNKLSGEQEKRIEADYHIAALGRLGFDVATTAKT